MPVQTVHLIAAARPNFMKVAPLWHALDAAPDFAPVLVHTGQHYDANMSAEILSDLGLPDPDFHLGIGSGSHAEQTGRVMIAYGEVAAAHRPDWLVVVGDVNSTLACALDRGEARHQDGPSRGGAALARPAMPEEINRHRHRRGLRRAVDAVARRRRQPSRRGRAGRTDHPRRQHHARQLRDEAPGDRGGGRARRASAATAAAIASSPSTGRPMSTIPASSPRSPPASATIQAQLPIVFPVHPRTAARLAGDRPRRLARAGRRAPDRALALCPLHEPGRRRRARSSPTAAASRKRPPISASPASPCATTPSGRSPSSRAPIASPLPIGSPTCSAPHSTAGRTAPTRFPGPNSGTAEPRSAAWPTCAGGAATPSSGTPTPFPKNRLCLRGWIGGSSRTSTSHDQAVAL